jgi:hypothetical protein
MPWCCVGSDLPGAEFVSYLKAFQNFVGSQPESGRYWHWAVILRRKKLVTPKRRLGIHSATEYTLGDGCGTGSRMQLPAKSRLVFTGD